MKEIEVKILEINPEEMKKKLLGLGAEKIEAVDIHSLHFDQEDQRIKNNDQLLRVRKIGERVELCFKNKSESARFKNSEEIEVYTTDFNNTVKILKRIGFNQIFEGKRTRESYRIGKTRFEIDFYPDIPPLMEIESPTEEEIEKFVKKLGYSMDQTTNMTGNQVLKHYHNKKKTTTKIGIKAKLLKQKCPAK